MRISRVKRFATWSWCMLLGVIVFWSLVALFVAGCGATARGVMLPDGSKAAHITCKSDPADCLDEAEDLCPKGYYVLAEGSSTGAVVWHTAYVTAVSPTYSGSVTIRCRKPL